MEGTLCFDPQLVVMMERSSCQFSTTTVHWALPSPAGTCTEERESLHYRASICTATTEVVASGGISRRGWSLDRCGFARHSLRDSAFGEDQAGEIYLTDHALTTGTIFRIIGRH
jgi:hypothetical protein